VLDFRSRTLCFFIRSVDVISGQGTEQSGEKTKARKFARGGAPVASRALNLSRDRSPRSRFSEATLARDSRDCFKQPIIVQCDSHPRLFEYSDGFRYEVT
jgi:hypothetical protein